MIGYPRFLVRLVGISLGFVMMLVLASCTTSRYSMEQDVGPSGDFDASQVPDAIPVWEPLSPKGNQTPYTVRGERYHLMSRAQDYAEEGIASWYGLKFHGELTSNGEIYNMYAMSAAHKTLPLPSYLRVTNLENQLSIIVRVNDRGPFHEDRVIDLSYAAANKLGYAKKGTAKVKLEVISPVQSENETVSLEPDRLGLFVQVGAFSKESSAESLKKQSKPLSDGYESFVALAPNREPSLYRVRIGPIADRVSAGKIVKSLERAGIGNPMVITRALSAKNL